jgi:ADP-heptose:LPS heptosyltransferase
VKILIVRLSSFGDILQAQACLQNIYSATPASQTAPLIDWLVRDDFKELLAEQPLHAVFSLPRKSGPMALFKMIWQLSQTPYTHIYDAHNNLRSFWIRTFLPLLIFFRHRLQPRVLVRSKNRWRRFLFFKLNRPVFKMPFRGSHSFLSPLEKWNISTEFQQRAQWNTSVNVPVPLPKHYIAIAPSAAWETKRWPVGSWQKLIELLPDDSFVVLGGPDDSFCSTIANVAPERVVNAAGTLSLLESCAVIRDAQLTISGDTGLLHAADQMRKLNIGLIGPTAFGYTSQNISVIVETQLACKPCSKDGRDPCKNAVFQKCMLEITPEKVAYAAGLLLGRRQQGHL